LVGADGAFLVARGAGAVAIAWSFQAAGGLVPRKFRSGPWELPLTRLLLRLEFRDERIFVGGKIPVVEVQVPSGEAFLPTLVLKIGVTEENKEAKHRAITERKQ
jgi:hypothetical protein